VLAGTVVPTDQQAARDLWQAYSAPWQFWNVVRTVVSGVALVLTGLAIHSLTKEPT